MKNIAVYGGSFDPIHYGHISLAEAAFNELNIDKLYFLPAGIQPFKRNLKVTSKEHRLNMLKLAIKNNNKFCVFTSEVDEKRVSYTYNSLVRIKNQNHCDKVFFVLGTDSFLTLDNWHQSEALLKEFAFVVGKRPGFKSQELFNKIHFFKENYNTDIIVLENELVDISSSEIKKRLKNGSDVSDLVPKNVERYIYENRLY